MYGYNFGYTHKYNQDSVVSGCSYRLDKSNSAYLDFGDSFDAALTGTAPQWTQVIVFRRRNVSNADPDTLFSKWSGSGNQRSYRVAIETNNKLKFDYTGAGSTPVTYTATSTAFLTNTSDFYFLAVRFDGSQTVSADVMDFYLGGTGVLAKTVSTDLDSGGSHDIYASTATDKVGAITGGAGSAIFFADIVVNQYYIFDEIVSDARLNTLFNSGSPLDPTGESGLVHLYDFNGDSWNGSEYDVLDDVGAVDGVSINLVDGDLICS